MLTENYTPEDDVLRGLTKRDRGNISVYAHGYDYHNVMKKRLKRYGGWFVNRTKANIKVFVDGKLTAESSNENGQVKYEIKDPSWEYVNNDVGFENSVGWVYDSGYSYMIYLTQFLGGRAFINEFERPDPGDLPTFTECEYIKFEELPDTPNTQYANRKAPDMDSKHHVESVSRRYS